MLGGEKYLMPIEVMGVDLDGTTCRLAGFDNLATAIQRLAVLPVAAHLKGCPAAGI